MASAESNTIYRTYTQDDGTKKRTAFRVKVDYNYDGNGKPVDFQTSLQNDLVAIDKGITGGGTNATWTTGATLLNSNVWDRKHRDTTQTNLGFVMPDDGWADLNDRGSNFSSQVNNTAASALAKRFNGEGYGRTFGMDTQAGAMYQLMKSQGTNQQGPPDSTGSAGSRLSTPISIEAKEQTRESYPRGLYYPSALRNNAGQDKLEISVLKYKSRKPGETSYKLGKRPGYSQRIIGSVFLPVPGGVGDNSSVSWGPDQMDPVSLGMANAVFDSLGSKTPGSEAVNQAQKIANEIAKDKGAVKTGLQGYFTKQITGVNILTRRTGAVVNPNMELLFNGPQLRPFAFNYKFSPRDREESYMVKRIIRMFKQSMAPQRTESQLFLKSPNTYKLKWIAGRGREHEFLPRIKECALQGFNVNYTPDGNYATYDDTSMVSYEVQFSFTELEPVYNDDYTKIDGNRDTSIGY